MYDPEESSLLFIEIRSGLVDEKLAEGEHRADWLSQIVRGHAEESVLDCVESRELGVLARQLAGEVAELIVESHDFLLDKRLVGAVRAAEKQGRISEVDTRGAVCAERSPGRDEVHEPHPAGASELTGTERAWRVDREVGR